MKRNETGHCGTNALRFFAWLLLPACLLLAQPAAAQDERAEREIEAAKEKARQLMRESEELRHKAEQLEAKIAEQLARREHGVAEQDELLEILEGLEHGMVALERLGRREELRMLGRVADEVRAQRRAARKGRDVIGIGASQGRSEREVAMHQLEIMRTALPALREGERRDAAELLERAIHAREVNLEGRRDEEAHQIRERSPGIGDQAEILLLAAELWQKFGHEKKAEAVGDLGRQFQAKFRRAQAAGEQKRAEGERASARAIEHFDLLAASPEQQARETQHRLELLEERLARLERMMEEMQEALHSIKR
jgi:hypothetical protein